MRDMMKRILSLLLAFTICLPVFSNTVSALDAHDTDEGQDSSITSNTDPPETTADTELPPETDPINPKAEQVDLDDTSSTVQNATVDAVESTAVVVYTNDLQKVHYTKPGHSYDYTRQFAAVYQVEVDDSGILYNAYCVEPWNGIEDHDNYSGYEGTMDQISGEIGDASPDPSPEQMEAIGLVMLYGAHELPTKEDPEHVYFSKTRLAIATQLIIWEICCNDRASAAPYTRTDSKWYDAFIDDSNGCYYSSAAHSRTGQIMGIDKVYEELAFRLENHYTIPSFATDQKSDVAACTYKMTGNGDGTYSITLTDTNGVLDYFTFADGDGLTYAVDGNQLTITADSTFASGSIQSAIKYIPAPEKSSYFLWANGDEQKLCSVSEAQYDPLPAYFALELDVASVDIAKTTSDGNHLEGWQFSIYSDAACTHLISGPHTTDSSGHISVAGLSAGTVYVKEIGHTDPAVNAQYQCDSTNPQEVLLTTGQISSVCFFNKRNMGQAKIIKTVNNPEAGTVEGWTFEVHKTFEANGAIALEYVATATTDAEGTILLNLDPGMYVVYEILEEDSLWKSVPLSHQMVRVIAGQTAEVTFTNTLRPGSITVFKTDAFGMPLAGAEFLLEWSADGTEWNPVTFTDSETVSPGTCTSADLTDGKLVVDSSGVISFTGLYPLHYYRLAETRAPDGYNLLAGYAFQGRLPEENDLAVELTVANAHYFELPMTGASALLYMPLIGSLSFAVSAALLVVSTCRRKQAE